MTKVLFTQEQIKKASFNLAVKIDRDLSVSHSNYCKTMESTESRVALQDELTALYESERVELWEAYKVQDNTLLDLLIEREKQDKRDAIVKTGNALMGSLIQ